MTGHFPCMFCGQVCKSIAGLKNHWRAAKKREINAPARERPHYAVTDKLIRWAF